MFKEIIARSFIGQSFRI